MTTKMKRITTITTTTSGKEKQVLQVNQRREKD